MITGAPGIGKTTVWRKAADTQPVTTVVLRTTGLQAGGQAGLANLADLLSPVTDAVPRLPPPQAGALRMALGLADADGPVTTGLLELATVGLLRELAVAGVVVAVDDEQWMDQDSLRLLGSAVVRLKDVPVRWLVAVRSGHTGQGLAQVLDHELGPAVTRVNLAGLDDEALSQLVMDRLPGRWSPGVLRRVVALASGSPYAALELARETAAQGGRDGTLVHLPATLADSLRSRLDRLSSELLAVVQTAAVAETPTRALLRAVEGGAADGRVDEALEAGVLDADPPDPVLRFSHPLLREVAETMLSGPGQRRLHRAIGSALSDPDEAAWHLARGADEPDETLAERAEQAAQHANERGAPARAAALAQIAAELTPDPDSAPAWGRRISWLERLVDAGEYEQARRLSEKWAVHVPPSLRGRLTAVRARVVIDVEASCGLYAEAFAELAGRDPGRAAEAGTQMCLLLGIHQRRLGEAHSRVGPVIAQARAGGNPVRLRQTLAAAGVLAALAGEPGAGDQLREAVRLPGLTDMSFPYDAPETSLALWHLWRGEFGPARDLMNAVIDVAERQGSQESADNTRFHLAELEWRAGNWDAAAAHAAAVSRWSQESGYGQEGPSAFAISLVEAGRGNLERARELAATGVAQAEAQGDWAFAAQCRTVLGLAELSAEDPAAALCRLEPVADMLQEGGIGDPGIYAFTPDLIEAWAATGQLDRAVGRLALGTAQRKARQRRDAAATLDEAAAAFTALGARRWQALATAQRAGLAPGPDNTLTPTERRIADLVAAGQTNPEIAGTLYISVKTVEANLTRIYRKLGLRGRVELARSHRG